MIRLRTSRPNRSVPRGWSHVPRSIQMGGISFVVMSPAVGLCGARKAAKIAVRTSATRMPEANQGRSRLRMPDPGVQVAVEHVHEEIAGEIESAEHEHARLHDRIVARGDGLEDEAPQ